MQCRLRCGTTGCTVRTSAQPNAIAEYVWTAVPWLILALYFVAAVHRLLAAGEGDMCMSCQLGEGIAQPPVYTPIAKNECIEIQSAADPIRTVFNCGYSP